MQGQKLTLMEAFRLLLLFVCKQTQHTYFFSIYVYFYAYDDFFRRIYQQSGVGAQAGRNNLIHVDHEFEHSNAFKFD